VDLSFVEVPQIVQRHVVPASVVVHGSPAERLPAAPRSPSFAEVPPG